MTLLFSKVPLDRFQKEVAPRAAAELTLPPGVGVTWRPGFFDAALDPYLVRLPALVEYEDIESAEISESLEKTVAITNGAAPTQRELRHEGVHVILTPAARRRLAEFARGREGHPLVVVYDGWAAGFATAGEDAGSMDFRFSWLDEKRASAAAKEFVANITATRRRHQ
jgi:hypothetical protein